MQLNEIVSYQLYTYIYTCVNLYDMQKSHYIGLLLHQEFNKNYSSRILFFFSFIQRLQLNLTRSLYRLNLEC